MSLLGYKKHVEEGDLVIIFIGHESMVAVTINQGKTTQTRYGAVRHSDVLGKEFGSKISTVNQRGYVYILHPTPELWTVNLPHRTQILYFADISMITMQLELKPGSLVVESGTGSGSMSHAIARTVALNGHLYTFEFHQQRSELARAEFVKHGLGDVVTVQHRDVCESGFGLDLKVDAVFLDLPSPHLAVKHAKEVMKSGGRICSFSPCIEQVQRTCEEYHNQGFSDITTMECMIRNFDSRTVAFPVPNLGLELEETQATDTSKSNQSDRNTEKAQKEIKTDEGRSKEEGGIPNESAKNNDDFLIDDPGNGKPLDKEGQTQDNTSGKRNAKDTPGDDENTSSKRFKKTGGRKGKAKSVQGQYTLKCAVPNKEQAGHTGYLTFATLFFNVSAVQESVAKDSD